MAHALEAAVRSLTGEPLVPYMGRESRALLADRLAGRTRYAQRWGASGESALARVLEAVLRAEVADLVLGRADPTGVQLLKMSGETGRLVPTKDINRPLAIEELVREQLVEALPHAKVVDRVVHEGLFRFCIDAGEDSLGVIRRRLRRARCTRSIVAMRSVRAHHPLTLSLRSR